MKMIFCLFVVLFLSTNHLYSQSLTQVKHKSIDDTISLKFGDYLALVFRLDLINFSPNYFVFVSYKTPNTFLVRLAGNFESTDKIKATLSGAQSILDVELTRFTLGVKPIFLVTGRDSTPGKEAVWSYNKSKDILIKGKD